jgi:proline utilization trans-activator
MHANMQGQGLDDAHVQRSMNAWWTVYILDRQMSSLMGVPLALKDSEISAPLPAIAGSRQKSLALEIHVKLSRILSHILNSKPNQTSQLELDADSRLAVYGSEGRLTRKFISSTKSALKDIAEVSDELKTAFGGLRGSSAGGISRLVAHLHLLHHQVRSRSFLSCADSYLNSVLYWPRDRSSLVCSNCDLTSQMEADHLQQLLEAQVDCCRRAWSRLSISLQSWTS